MLLNIIIVVILRLYEIRASAQIPLEATQKADDLSIGLRNMTIMHRKYCKYHCNYNETPTVRGLAADNNNKLYTETMIFLWNNHYNLNFIM